MFNLYTYSKEISGRNYGSLVSLSLALTKQSPISQFIHYSVLCTST